MSVREFLDQSGTRWRAWPVTPDSLHPATKIEEYVDDIYHTGWLVFETVAGDEKRRLPRFPRRWAEASDAELQAMLARADFVRGTSAEAGRSPHERETPEQPSLDVGAPAEENDDEGPPPLVRTFRYPGGRYWTATVVVRPGDEDRPALRFTAGARIIELASWPPEWVEYTDEQLVDLLRWAAPRVGGAVVRTGTPRRRWDDRPDLGEER
jgi:hypothetical protein